MGGIIPKKKRSISAKAPAFEALLAIVPNSESVSVRRWAPRFPNAYRAAQRQPILPSLPQLNAPIGA
jgi:hypothetical protein